MGTCGVQMKRVFPWLVGWARRASTWDFNPALAALISPVQNIFSSPCTISLYVSPSPSNLGRQSGRVAYLLICVSGFIIRGRWLYSNKKQANDLSISCLAMAKSYRLDGMKSAIMASTVLHLIFLLCEKLWIRSYRHITCRNRTLNSYR